jgi:hypothetical protein
MLKSLYDSVKVGLSIVPAVYTADQDGSAVDTMGYNSAMAVCPVGDLDLASGNETYTFRVYESADGSTNWTAVSGATAAVTADNTTGLIRVDDLLNRLRYLRVTLDVDGTTPSCPCSAVICLGNPVSSPVR